MLDLFARRVVGWATSSKNATALALRVLESPLRDRRPPPGLIHHSDRGSPYASADYRAAVEVVGVVASMNRTGDCWDNAVAESFFATTKAELIEQHRFATRAEATAAIGDYVEGFYNASRRHSHLDYVSPNEFELVAQRKATAA